MKRILSVLLALVMVIGMLPMSILSASAAEETVTITFDDTSKRTTLNDEQQVWTENGITFTNDRTGAQSAVADYSNPVRLYKGSSFTIAYTEGTIIRKIIITTSGTSYATAIQNTVGDQATASNSEVTITPTAESNSFTASDLTAATRIKSIQLTVSTTSSDDCAHTNVETIAAVAATCTTAGNTEGTKCTDCGTILSGNETIAALGHTYDEGVVTAPTCTEDGYTLYTCTVCGSTKKDNWVDATGHTYVDGTCSACGIAKPAGLDGKYYIAAIRSSGNYQYMTNNLGTASTQRYQIVDSGLTTLPESIETIVDAQVFELIASGDGYKIRTGDQYLGWTSGNSGTLVDEATAIVATIENAENGAYNIHFTASDAERYLALNSNSSNNYFAWYKQGQAENLYLVPVSENAAACTHTNTTTVTVPASCGVAGSVTVTCDACGETISTEVIEALDHNYVDGTCSVCGAIQNETEPDEFEQASATITFDDTAKRTEGNSSKQVWEENGIVVTNTGSVNTQYYNPVRFYKNSVVKIAYPQMTKIVINSASGDYLTQLQTSITVGTVTVEGTTVTIVLDEAIDEYTITLSAGQARANSITVYAVAGVCAHEFAEDAWTIVTPATCETAGSKTGTCSKCGETVEKEIPALGHAYSYDAEAGKMVCANCGDAFMNTIAEAKAYTDTNKVYYFKGIVTYVSGKTVYVQDDTAGVCVYFTNVDNAAGIAAGDELLVWDTMTTYGGLIETTYTTSAEIQILSSGNELPAAQSATLTELLANPSKYQGSRVTISGMTMGKINTSGNTVMTAAEGGTINLYQAKGMADNVTENDIVDITVVFSIYSNAYQLLLNQSTATTDVVVTTEGVPSDLALSDISVAKAGTEGTFFKVKGIVTFVDGASVYMQDATGGIVARLASGVTAPAIGTEIEAIGAYTTYNGLIQLEGATFTEISADNTVEAQEVTLAEMVEDTTMSYQSKKVSMKGLTITAVGEYNATYKNVDYTVTDGTNSFVLYRTPAATQDDVLAVGDVINVVGVVGYHNKYQLRVVDANDITVVPSVKLTHISLKPGADALGFKAAATNMPEGAEIGIRMWVSEDKVITNTIAKDTISLRLQNIMAANGGEIEIHAQAVIVLDGEVIAESQEVTTSMRRVIEHLNDNWESLEEEQTEAIITYIKANEDVMKNWNVNSFVTFSTEE